MSEILGDESVSKHERVLKQSRLYLRSALGCGEGYDKTKGGICQYAKRGYCMVLEEKKTVMGPLTDKGRFDAVRERAAKLGVWDINFSSPNPPDSLACYESALDIIEQNKEILDRKACEYGV